MKKIILLIASIMLSTMFATDLFAQQIVKDNINADGVRTVQYVPANVCSKMIDIQVKDGVILDVKYTGGCSGNAKGLSALLKGMKVDDAILKLEGIPCGNRPTSCPDQLSKALKMMKKSKPNNK